MAVVFLYCGNGSAKEIIMECKEFLYEDGKFVRNSTRNRIFKWKDSLIGKAKVYERKEGKWIKSCTSSNSDKDFIQFRRINEIEYAKDLGFKCNIDLEAENEKYYFEVEGSRYLDFETVTAKGSFNEVATDKLGKETKRKKVFEYDCNVKE